MSKRPGRSAKVERQTRAKLFANQRAAGVAPGIRQYWENGRWVKR